MPLNESVVDAVANSDFKANSEIHTQDVVASRNRVLVIAENATAGQINRLLSLDIEQALSIKQATTGHAAGEQAIGSALGMAALQSLVKAAQTVPPVTAPPPAT